MFLDTLRLNNFRSFEDEQICFGKDLTILVGENNGGKSNTIDALRLITTPLSGRREIYCEPSDIRFGGAEPKFEVQATFSDLSVPQQGRLISAVTDRTLEKVTFGLTYDETQKRLPVRPTSWAGHLRSAPEPGCQDMIRHVYLPPLRDAKRALASGIRGERSVENLRWTTAPCVVHTLGNWGWCSAVFPLLENPQNVELVFLLDLDAFPGVRVIDITRTRFAMEARQCRARL